MSGPHSTVLPDARFVTIPASAGLATDDALPWLIDVDVFEQAVTNTNWNGINTDALSLLRARKASTGAQNAEISFDVVLAKGTWTFELMHLTFNDRGIYTVYFGATSVGTIDGYSAGAVYNVLSSVTGIAVATTAKVRLKLQMATKNASSSAYYGVIQHIQLRRTA